jgi:hypothetical protein
MVLMALDFQGYVWGKQHFSASHDFRVIDINRTVGLVVMIAAFHLTDQRQSRVQFPDSSFCFFAVAIGYTIVLKA